MMRIAAVLLLGLVALVPAAWGKAAARKLRIAVVPKALNMPVFGYARIGAERAAAELGDIEVLWNGPDVADAARQQEIVESFIGQGVDGISVSVLDVALLTSAIDRASEKGIPVVTWDSDAPDSKRVAFYGVDDFASGRILGQEAARLLGGKGTVAIVTSGSANLQKRTEGVKAALAAHPRIRIVETFDIQEDPIRCAEAIAEGTKRYPNLGAWVSVGGWPVFSRRVLAGVNTRKTRFLSFDTVAPATDLLKDGKVQVLLGQKYFGWGSEPVKLLAAIARENRRPASTFIDSGVDVVTRANVDAYLLEWARLERGGR